MLVAQVGILGGLWCSSRGITWLLSLNILMASAVLIHATTRARYIAAAMDWPYFGLIAFELGVLMVAILAFRGSRVAAISSYVAFGLHTLASVTAVLFAFTFKIETLM